MGHVFLLLRMPHSFLLDAFIANFVLLGAGYFCSTTDILELCSVMWISYLETVSPFWVSLLSLVSWERWIFSSELILPYFRSKVILGVLSHGLEVVRFPTLAGGSVSHSQPCVMFRMDHSNPFRGSTHPRYFPVTFILSSIQLKTPRDSLPAQCSPFWYLACELQL